MIAQNQIFGRVLAERRCSLKSKDKIIGVLSAWKERLRQNSLAPFMQGFVGGEVKVKRREEYCFQGGIRGLSFSEKMGQTIICVTFLWLAEKIRLTRHEREILFESLKKEDPDIKFDSIPRSVWRPIEISESYSFHITVSHIMRKKNGFHNQRELVVVTPEEEKAHFIQARNPLCIREKLEKKIPFLSVVLSLRKKTQNAK